MLRADSDADEGAAATSRTLQLVTLCAAIWAPTFLAELVELSGIVATLFAAIGVRHWATPNLQSSSTVDAKPVANAVLSTLAHFADTIIFLYLGLSVPARVEIMTSTPSTRRLLDGVAVSIPHRSTDLLGHPRTLVDFHTGTSKDARLDERRLLALAVEIKFQAPHPSALLHLLDGVEGGARLEVDNITHWLIPTHRSQAPAQGAS